MNERKERRLTKFDNAKVDNVNSQFRHIFFLSNGKDLPGYSGKYGFHEKWIRQKNFVNYFLRLFIFNAYYPGSIRGLDSIQVYDHRSDEPICTVNKGYINWEAKFALDKDWDEARKKVLAALKEAIALTPQPDIKSEPLQKIQFFHQYRDRPKIRWDSSDMRSRGLDTEGLIQFCKDLVADGHPYGEVENFYHKYKKQHLPSTTNENRKQA